jgi:acetate CoA/acetoacetate CoA-transferase beta subunit
VALVVAELAVIGFPDGRATLLETQEGVTVEEVIAATEAELAISPELSISKVGSENAVTPSMGEAI